MITATIHAGARSICTSEIERGERQQFVGERIDELPERRDLLAAARQIAVGPVGERGEAENRGADELRRHAENLPPLELRQQHDHEQRHQADARHRERVRQVHGPTAPMITSVVAMKAILLAGGKGTRLRPLTIHTPKPIVPIFDRPFLNYQLDLLKQVPEIDEVMLSLNYQPRRIEEIFGDGGDTGLGHPLRRRAGAARHRRRHPLRRRIAARIGGGVQRRRADAGGSGGGHRPAPRTEAPRPPSSSRRSRTRAPTGWSRPTRSGNIQRFLEKPKPDEITCDTINAGIYVLEPDTFDRIPERHAVVDRAQLLPVAHRARRDVRGLRRSRLLDRHRHA